MLDISKFKFFAFMPKKIAAVSSEIDLKTLSPNWKKVQKKGGLLAILLYNIIDPKSNYGYIPRFFVAKATRLIATM